MLNRSDRSFVGWVRTRVQFLRFKVARFQGVSMRACARASLLWLVRHPVLSLGLLLVWALESGAPATEALPRAALTIHQATLYGGIWLLVIQFLWSAAVGASGGHGLWRSAVIALERSALIALALVSIRRFGDDLADAITVAMEHPDTAMAIVAAAVLLRVILAMAPDRPHVHGYEALRGVAVMTLGTQRLPADIRRTALHEAGHLLLFAARDVLPDDLHVKVFDVLGPLDEFRGRVTHVSVRPVVLTEQYLWWSMLMRLGGTEAERVVLGDRGDGAVQDSSNWIWDATAFLANGFGTVFYAQPDGADQTEHNRAALNELKAKCTEVVHDFLSRNVDLLTELRQVIASELALDRARIEPFLRRAIGTEALALGHQGSNPRRG
jgi:hypothetical protein